MTNITHTEREWSCWRENEIFREKEGKDFYYVARNNERPYQVAAMMGVPLEIFLEVHRRTWSDLRRDTKFKKNTELLWPCIWHKIKLNDI